jgi:hypothetical protein
MLHVRARPTTYPYTSTSGLGELFLGASDTLRRSSFKTSHTRLLTLQLMMKNVVPLTADRWTCCLGGHKAATHPGQVLLIPMKDFTALG